MRRLAILCACWIYLADITVTQRTPAAEINFRLVGGNSSAGRVEVFYNGVWGTICDDGFGEAEARVACRYFGFSGGIPRREAYFGRGTGRIWLDDLQCNGTETSLEYCISRQWGFNNCYHSEDAGMECIDENIKNHTTAEVRYRLADGSSHYEGRIEVLYNNTWGTICNDSFGSSEALVICGYFGFRDGIPTSGSIYGRGSGQIWMDNLHCNGTEGSLEYCKFDGWGKHNCDNGEDAGVRCEDQWSNSSDEVEFRFTRVPHSGNNDGTSGTIEVIHNNEWGSVCDVGFGQEEATVACRQFGFKAGRAVPGLTYHWYYYWNYDLDYMATVDCEGTEATLNECKFSGWGTSDCDYGESAGVQCFDGISNDTDRTVKYRLVDGSVPSAGRVEVFYNGVWGTICDDEFGVNEARVVCRSLNYTGGYPVEDAEFGEGVGRIWMDELHCTGNENSLEECSFNGWGIHDCWHFEDAGVHCIDSESNITLNEVEFRLADGPTPNAGRVEVLYNGIWGTVCDDGFDQYAADVVCRYFGYKGGVPDSDAYFGRGRGRIWMDELHCVGTENTLANCSFGGWGFNDCSHWEDAGVVCGNSSSNHTLATVKFRLVGGPTPYSGRVEVFYKDSWGTVCDDSFTSVEASVVCRSLGFRGGTAHSGAYYGRGSGNIWLDDIQCTGEECSLAQCRFDAWGDNDCWHDEDISVKCRAPKVSYRLANGSRPSAGRVELSFDGEWGTVCSNGFDDREAKVVCRQLGFSGGVAINGSIYGEGKGHIWMNSLECSGTEDSLQNCIFTSCGDVMCTHSQDAAVTCTVIDCGLPKVPTGYILGPVGATSYNKNVSMSCDAGFTGKATDITCLSDGTWSVPSGCHVVNCNQPTGKKGYRLDQVSTTIYGSKVIVKCDMGYTGSPPPLTCTSGGSWSELEGCNMIQCGDPQVPEGYKLYSVVSKTYGSSVPVICDTGYSGTPKPIRCHADGFWSNFKGCAIKVCPPGKYGDTCAKTCPCVQTNTKSCDVASGSCLCKEGWAGKQCNVDVDECSSPGFHKCPAGTGCKNTPGSYTCLCKCDGKFSGLQSSDGSTGDSTGSSGGAVAAAIVMGVLNLILIALLVLLFLRHKNIIPPVKDDWSIKFTRQENTA